MAISSEVTNWRPLGLEPGMGKIAAKYGVTFTWDTEFDTYRAWLWIHGNGTRTKYVIDSAELRALRDQGDYDVIWTKVEQACRELTDEMAGLYQLADEAKR